MKPCFVPAKPIVPIRRNPPSPSEVLDFIDTFAGQENDAEEVRDFVQAAAKYVAMGRSREAWRADPLLTEFVEWCER